MCDSLLTGRMIICSLKVSLAVLIFSTKDSIESAVYDPIIDASPYLYQIADIIYRNIDRAFLLINIRKLFLK